MSAEFAFFLTIICFGSCFACYRLGATEERERWRSWRRQYLATLREKEGADE